MTSCYFQRAKVTCRINAAKQACNNYSLMFPPELIDISKKKTFSAVRL